MSYERQSWPISSVNKIGQQKSVICHAKIGRICLPLKSSNDVIDAAEEFLGDQDTAFYQTGIEMLQKRRTKCIEVHGDYVEK